MPNTLGMALFGDGGIMASKPYAASGKYIDKMSNYCQSCIYNPQEAITENACPFNALYWDFMARNESKLKQNQRLPFVYSTWENFEKEKQTALRQKAAEILEQMRSGKL